MKILVVRFRQMGDAILSTCIFNTIKRNAPETETSFVLNASLVPLFEGHPAIDHLIPFSDTERHSFWRYLGKVWTVVRHGHYDAVIDLRSTLNTLPFVILTPRTKFRIGLQKWYTRPFFNYRYGKCGKGESMIDHDLKLLSPFSFPVLDRRFSLPISETERTVFRNYMERHGVDFFRPIVLLGVTAKLEFKTWNREGMAYVIRHLISAYPDVQLIFNYTPGREEENARSIYAMLKEDAHILINLQAQSPRELAAMATWITFYFGNEGGTRHLVHSQGKPSFVVLSPSIRKKVWLPVDQVPTEGIGVEDVLSEEEMRVWSYEKQYAAIRKEEVWKRLQQFITQYHLLSE